MAGALTLEALFTLLNLLGVSGALEATVQGVIIIAAVAFAARPPALRQMTARRIRTPRQRDTPTEET